MSEVTNLHAGDGFSGRKSSYINMMSRTRLWCEGVLRQGAAQSVLQAGEGMSRTQLLGPPPDVTTEWKHPISTCNYQDSLTLRKIQCLTDPWKTFY